ncbi:MAG: TIGR03545 family protein [Deltaproteobacteria bacterium]|nr:TIGR03545 family protein [Deltaproteobacteria bacterium]
MKWIRWQGLAAFAAVTGLIGLFWFVYVDRWVERYIENWGTFAVGAKVELDKADVSLFPLGLTLTRMQVTNPGKPMQNAVEIKRIAFLMDFWQLLLGKTHIDDMSVEGMEFGTRRKYSGEAKRNIDTVVPRPVTDFVVKQTGPLEFPALEVPDVMAILKNEDLASVRLVETIRAEVDSERDAWEKRVKNDLPGKKTFNDYKARVEKIKKDMKAGSAAAITAAATAAKLPQEIRGEIDKIEKARKELEKTLELVKKRAEEARKAPFEDIERLKDKYNLSGKGLTNLTRTFMGPTYASYLSQAFMWHARISPYLEPKEESPKEKKPERGKGVDVKFKERRPLPDFLISKSRVTLKVEEVGEFTGDVRNVTDNQAILGSPLTVRLVGEKLETLIREASLDMEFNRTRPRDPKDTVALSGRGFQFRDVPLSKDGRWPIDLKRADADVSIKMEFLKSHVNGLISANMTPVEIVTGFGQMKNPVAKAVDGALRDIQKLFIEAEVRGSPEEYDLILRSNLDEILEKAIGRIITELVKEFEQRLRAEIMKRVQKPLEELQAKVGIIGGLDKDLEALVKEGEKLIEEAIKSAGAGKGSLPIPGGLKLPGLSR